MNGSLHWLRHSLAARVTAMFMLIVALAAAGLGAYLYRELVDEIERRDDIQLLGKLRQVQIVLGRPGAAELVRNHPDFFRDTMSGQENSLVRIVAPGAAGQRETVLADINPRGERYPVPIADRASGASPARAAIADWTGSHGEPGRVVAAAARLGDATVTVIVARLYGERAAMFASYRHRIVGAAAISALAAALCAALLLHRGLRPLRVIAAHAALVRPGTLARRLAAGDAPSELLPLVAALNAMLDRLQEGYARLSGFSADLAHEFRTPITNLLGQSQVLLAQPRNVAEYEQLLASNIEELERLARMIESMLFLARAGQEDVLPARQSLTSMDELRKVADFFEGMAEEQGVHITCTGDAVVRADPALLRRALANLVSNAVRHAAPGSTIVLDARQQAGVTELSVTNTGAPIAPEHLPHLFDRFYRADPARGNADGSTGLGLAIVSAIMTVHGGTASVAAHGDRACFTLAFP
jgi:two-component system heavy metal sensor histidine kinase CusS